MPDKRITDFTALTGANVAIADLLPIVDVSDTTDDATGTNKKITRQEFFLAPIYFKRTGTTVSVTPSQGAMITAITGGTGTRTVTLQAAANCTNLVYIIKDEAGTAGTNNIVIDGNASETIDGALTITISTNYGVVWLYSNGTAWFTI